MNNVGVARSSPLAIVLPHSEAFQHAGAGAISLCVRDAAAASSLCDRIAVLGEAVAEPFTQTRFLPVTPTSWLHGRRGNRYVQGVVRGLRELSPAYIEIHNRPVYIAALRKAFPHTPIALYIHNDPHSIRGIRSSSERACCIEQVSVVICVSDFIRRRMLEGIETHRDAHKLRVVLNGVDTAALTPSPHKRREIIFVGRLSPQKGGLIFAQAALRIAAQLPDWRFVMVGARSFGKPSLSSDYEREVAAAMQRLGAQGEITGYLPREQAMARLAKAAIAVIPSQWDDPCPLSVIEALASGCATAAAPCGGIPELIKDAGVLVQGGCPVAWADVLVRFAEDDAMRTGYQRAARARAVQGLDICHTAARLDEIRNTLIQARSGNTT